jgi:hypothetical protein
MRMAADTASDRSISEDVHEVLILVDPPKLVSSSDNAGAITVAAMMTRGKSTVEAPMVPAVSDRQLVEVLPTPSPQGRCSGAVVDCPESAGDARRPVMLSMRMR